MTTPLLHYGVVEIYAPSQIEVHALAEQASLPNPHPKANRWLLDKVRQPPNDWDSRTWHTTPGPVWTVPSDTCMTGRPHAPDNIAYAEDGSEFVYRQPLNEGQLIGIMRADSEEVFACYRFDGFERWTGRALDSWSQQSHVIEGWLRQVLQTESDGRVAEGLNDYLVYLNSPEFDEYLRAFRALLPDGEATTWRWS